MTRGKRLGRFVLAAVVVGFAMLVVAGGAVGWGFARVQEINRLLSHTYEVELALTEFRSLTERVETARRGYLLDADERFRRTFEETEAQLPSVLDRVGRLTADNPVQVERVAQLRDGMNRQRQMLEASFARRAAGDAEGARAAFATDGGAEVIRGQRAVTLDMIQEEQQLLADRRAQQQDSLFHSYLLLGAAAVLLLVVAGGTIALVRRNLAALRQSRDRLEELNDNLEAAVLERTSDLQRANDEIQRFAYIVSHDLRSPLVNVMGFTSELEAATQPLSAMIDKVEAEAPQLVSEDARLAVREDLPEAVGFIRSSTQKMDRLINAILRLSREGRRVIAPERLDLADMAGGIVASLRHRLDEIGAEVAVKPLPAIVSDRVAVEQILSNLVENAVKYLKSDVPGRITVAGQRQGERVVIEVSDNGRGIDPKDHERVFDLFRRSGAQDQPGEGIGLAHVRALAYRLGGTVACWSELGQGATFRLSLPAVYSARKEG